MSQPVLVAASIMKGGMVFLVLMGLAIAAIGALFTLLMWNSYTRAVEQHAWPQVDGVVLSSVMEEWLEHDFTPPEYRLNILYGYEWKGERKTGSRFDFRGNPKYNKREKIEKLLEAYPAGKKIRVYVKPDDANFAMLKPDSKAAGYSIWFPLLFVFGGMGIVVRAIRARAL
ncbi:MAG: hypothetical protein RL346_1073 [Verrucomicrobiota bacterium]